MPTQEQLAAAAFHFLQRTTLKGDEVETFMLVSEWLKSFRTVEPLQPPKEE
jgi:hypothetical protein